MVWESISQVAVLRVVVPTVGFKPFTRQREAGSCEFPPNCVSLCQGWGLWWDCVWGFPTHVSVGFFLFSWCIRANQLVSGFISEGIILYIAEHSVCLWKEVSSGLSYVAILNQKNILWILIRNSASTVFLMAQIMLLCGKTWLSMIELRNDSAMLDSRVLRIP